MDSSTQTEGISAFTSRSVGALSCVMLHRVCCYISKRAACMNQLFSSVSQLRGCFDYDRQGRQGSAVNAGILHRIRGRCQACVDTWVFFCFFLPFGSWEVSTGSVSWIFKGPWSFLGGKRWRINILHSVSGGFHHFWGLVCRGQPRVWTVE